MDYQPELEFARRIAVAAGDNAQRIRAGGISAETKSDDSPVTVADKDNERLIREAIERAFPADGILGEEGASKAGSSGRRCAASSFVSTARAGAILAAIGPSI